MHVQREHNRVANSLVKLAISYNRGTHELEDTPLRNATLLHNDWLGATYNRHTVKSLGGCLLITIYE